MMTSDDAVTVSFSGDIETYRRDTMALISILNDTTAMQYLYDVDDEIVDRLRDYFDKDVPLMLGDGDFYSNDGESDYLEQYLRKLAERNGCTGHDDSWWSTAINEVQPKELYVETYDFSKHKPE